MERRRAKPSPEKSSPLPHDFLKMVTEVFTTNFASGLDALGKIKPGPKFEAGGAVYPDEIILSVTVAHGDELAATTVYASTDFDPRASSPTVQDLLGACVDAVASVYDLFFDGSKPERLKQMAEESLSAFEDIPFEWTGVEINKRTIQVKVDKSNPRLDQMTDDWLAKNDPKAEEHRKAEAEEMEQLFVRGPKNRGNGSGGETVH